MRIFLWIDGTQRAAAFAHYAFFSFFPSIILCVTVASLFFERATASTAIIGFIEGYIPLRAERKGYIVETLTGVVDARAPASIFATLLLCWAVMRFFATLIRATNRAWGLEVQDWWRQPLKSLLFLPFMVAAIPLAVAVLAAVRAMRLWIFPHTNFNPWLYTAASSFFALVLLFVFHIGFYKLAPRRKTRLSEVWAAALSTTILILVATAALSVYLKNFAHLNAVYGAFGGIMALLMWIYFSGSIFVFGACLCAAGDAALVHPALQSRAGRQR